MERKFSFKEAKELGDFYRLLLKRLNEAIKYPIKKMEDVKNQFHYLKSSGYFSKLTDAELDGEVYKEKEDQYQKLLLCINNYLIGNDLSHTSERLYSHNHFDIERRLESLSPACNPVAWFFTGKENKEKAIEQYQYLLNYKKESFVQDTLRLINQMKHLPESSAQEVKEHFDNHLKEYYDIVKRVDAPSYSNKNLYVDKVKALVLKNNSLADNLKSINVGLDEAENGVNRAIQYLKGFALIKLLKGIPVEELAREHKGMRTKAFRDARYDSMADIYAASVYNLASIHGVSQDVAYSAKRIANYYADNASKNIKLKLSTDDKNKASTGVVNSVYLVRRIRSITDDILKVKHEHGDELHDSFEILKGIGMGTYWPFISSEEKKKCINAYLFVRDVLYGELGDVIKRGYNEYNDLKKNPKTEFAWEDFSNNSIQYFNIIEELCPGALGTDDSVYGLPEELAKEIQDECIFPDGLLCTLRRYQEWGVKYILHQERVLLGDEMGLGKTVQAIASMVSLKNVGATHFVVVCPASVVTNWCREIVKHSLLRAIKVHGNGKANAFKAWLSNGGVAVTTYESCGTFKFDGHFVFTQLVVDEAHYIKNREANRSKRVRELCEHAERILFMTGTALENRVDEMIELISILKPRIAFNISRIAFMASAPEFRNEVAPVYYRRKREDVLSELPDLIENEEWCTMTKAEEEAYESAMLNHKYMEARRSSWCLPDLNKSSKAQRLLEIIEDAKNDDRKVLVFSFFLDTIKNIHNLLGFDTCLNPITGSLNPNRRQEIIDEFESAPPGTVLCSQIQSGGTGLNIQAASVVIICEPQFKPSIENQAISRAYRMGQSRNVQVFRLLNVNSLDERITELLKQKQEIFNAFADKSVAAEKSVEIDEKTFGDIISEEIERIKAKRNRNTNEQENDEE